MSIKEDKKNQENTSNLDARVSRMEKLLEENVEMNKEMKVMIRHINTYVAWQRIFGWLKLLLILVPLVIGFIYLPPLFKDLYQQVISLISSSACQ